MTEKKQDNGERHTRAQVGIGQDQDSGRHLGHDKLKVNRNGVDTLANIEHTSAAAQSATIAEGVRTSNSAQGTLSNQELGQHIYLLVQTIAPMRADKITGMFLELQLSEILGIIASETIRRARVQEALEILEVHERGDEGTPLVSTRIRPIVAGQVGPTRQQEKTSNLAAGPQTQARERKSVRFAATDRKNKGLQDSSSMRELEGEAQTPAVMMCKRHIGGLASGEDGRSLLQVPDPVNTKAELETERGGQQAAGTDDPFLKSGRHRAAPCAPLRRDDSSAGGLATPFFASVPNSDSEVRICSPVVPVAVLANAIVCTDAIVCADKDDKGHSVTRFTNDNNVEAECRLCEEEEACIGVVEVPQYCGWCGRESRSLIFIPDTGAYLCNVLLEGTSWSCAVRHLVRHHVNHVSARWLLPDSDGVLRCAHSGASNIFELGLVRWDRETAFLLSRCSAATLPGLFWRPLVGRKEGGFGCLDAELFETNSHMADRGRGERRAFLATPVPTTYAYAESTEYTRHFRHLLTLLSKFEYSKALTQEYENVQIRWKRGNLHEPVACFEISSKSGDKIEEGNHVFIRHEQLNLHLRAWVMEQGTDEMKCSCQAAIIAGELPLEFAELPLQGYRIVKEQVSISLDRMQSALNFFEQDHFTGVGSHLYAEWLYPGRSIPLFVPRRVAVSLAGLNETQKKAVELTNETTLLIVEGPPGTGKTHVSIRIVQQWLAQKRGRVLVCAASNGAATHLAIELDRAGVRNMLRYFPMSKESGEYRRGIPDHLLVESCVMAESELGKLLRLRKEVRLAHEQMQRLQLLVRQSYQAHLEKQSVIVCTCVAAGDARISKLRFRHLLVDEAAQATEPEVIVPLVLGIQQCVLVGDPQQLRPIIECQAASRGGLEVSALERLKGAGATRVMLNVQYRMHPSISIFPNMQFYAGAIEDGPRTLERHRTQVEFPWATDLLKGTVAPFLFWHRGFQSGGELRETTTQSYYNVTEVEAVNEAVQRLRRSGVRAEEIAVITMYEAQRTRLARALRNGDRTDLLIGNVDAVQGKERPYVILSLVRSNKAKRIGFIDNVRRANVALTRAQSGLLVIGDAETLRAHEPWRSLVENCRQRGLIKQGSSLDTLVQFDVEQIRDAETSFAAFARESLNDECASLTPGSAHDWPEGDGLRKLTMPRSGTGRCACRVCVVTPQVVRSKVTQNKKGNQEQETRQDGVPVSEVVAAMVLAHEASSEATTEEEIKESDQEWTQHTAQSGEWKLCAKVTRRVAGSHAYAAAYAQMRLFQYWWRARISGFLTAAQTIRYWSLANSSKEASYRELMTFVKANSFRHNIILRFKYGVELVRTQQGSEAKCAIRRLQVRCVRFRLVRLMHCGYGAHACTHRVLGPDGTRYTICYMAKHGDFVRQQMLARRVIAWSAHYCKALLKRIPNALFVMGFFAPGLMAEAVRQLGFGVIGIDNGENIRAARGWFTERVPQLYQDSPVVTCVFGDALDPAFRDRAVAEHAKGGTVVAQFDSASCSTNSTLDARCGAIGSPGETAWRQTARIASAQEGLDAAVAFASERYLHGAKGLCPDTPQMQIPYLVENLLETGLRNTATVGCTITSALSLGHQTLDRHRWYGPRELPFFVDRVLEEGVVGTAEEQEEGMKRAKGGAWLRAHSCAGISRLIQPPHPQGSPINPSCCPGQLVSLHNSGSHVYDKRTLCRILQMHPEHATSRAQLADTVPLLQGLHAGSQLGAWAAQIRLGVPLCSYTAAVRDPLLGAWVYTLLARCEESDVEQLLQIGEVIVIILPVNLEGQVLVGGGLHGAPPAFLRVPYPCTGDLLGGVVSQLADLYGVQVEESRLRFAGDLARGGEDTSGAQARLVMFAESLPYKDAKRIGAVPICEKGRFLYATGTQRLVSISLEKYVQALEANAENWEPIEIWNAAALFLVATHSLCAHRVPWNNWEAKIPARHQRRSVLRIPDGRVETVREMLLYGQGFQSPSDKFTSPHGKRTEDKNKEEPLALASAGAPQRRPLLQTTLPRAAAAAFARNRESCSNSEVATVTTDDETQRQAYVQACQRLGIRIKGLLTSGSRTDDNRPHAPRPNVAICRLAVIVGQGVVIMHRRATDVYQFMTATDMCAHVPVSRQDAARTTFRERERTEHTLGLVEAIQPWFQGYAQFDLLQDAVARAVHDERTAEDEIVIATRDDKGRLPSRFVGGRRVVRTLYRVNLPPSFDWSLSASIGTQTFQQATRHSAEQAGQAGALRVFTFEQALVCLSAQGETAMVGTLRLLLYGALHDTIGPALDDGVRRGGQDGQDAAIAAAVAGVEDYDSVKEEDEGVIQFQRMLQVIEQEETRTRSRRGNKLASLVLGPSDYNRRPAMEVYFELASFEQLRKGLKTVEARRVEGELARVEKGWVIRGRIDTKSPCFWAEVTEVKRFATFQRASEHFGDALVLTTSEEDSIKRETAGIEYEFYRAHNRRKGCKSQLSVERWCHTAGATGSVVGWRLRLLEVTVRTPHAGMFLHAGRGAFDAPRVFRQWASRLRVTPKRDRRAKVGLSRELYAVLRIQKFRQICIALRRRSDRECAVRSQQAEARPEPEEAGAESVLLKDSRASRLLTEAIQTDPISTDEKEDEDERTPSTVASSGGTTGVYFGGDGRAVVRAHFSSFRQPRKSTQAGSEVLKQSTTQATAAVVGEAAVTEGARGGTAQETALVNVGTHAMDIKASRLPEAAFTALHAALQEALQTTRRHGKVSRSTLTELAQGFAIEEPSEAVMRNMRAGLNALYWRTSISSAVHTDSATRSFRESNGGSKRGAAFWEARFQRLQERGWIPPVVATEAEGTNAAANPEEVKGADAKVAVVREKLEQPVDADKVADSSSGDAVDEHASTQQGQEITVEASISEDARNLECARESHCAIQAAAATQATGPSDNVPKNSSARDTLDTGSDSCEKNRAKVGDNLGCEVYTGLEVREGRVRLALVVHRLGSIHRVIRQEGVVDETILEGPLAVDMIGVLADCVSPGPNAEQKALYKKGLCTSVYFAPSAGSNGAFSRQATWRTPGTLQFERNSDKTPVCTLYTQWSAGLPSRAAQPEGRRDDKEQRVKWTRECLAKLSVAVAQQSLTSIAFDAGQFTERLLLRQLQIFAREHAEIRVLLVSRAAFSIAERKRVAQSSIEEARIKALAFLAEHEDGNSLSRQLGIALCNSIADTCQRSLMAEEETPQAASVFAAFAGDAEKSRAEFAAAFKHAVSAEEIALRIQQREARRGLELSNQATDEEYRQLRERDFIAGRVSEAELRAEAMVVNSLYDSVQVGHAPEAAAFSADAGDAVGDLQTHAYSAVRVRGEPPVRIRVSSAQGPRTPCRLKELYVLDESGLKTVRVPIAKNILDSGAGLTFFGTSLAERIMAEQPGALRKVSPLPSSVRRINGIGAGNQVKYWVTGTIEIGGVAVDLEDSPVINEIESLLIGNEAIQAMRGRIDYCGGKGFDGTFTLQSAEGVALSRPVQFEVTRAARLPFAASAEERSPKDEERPRAVVRFALKVGVGGEVTTNVDIQLEAPDRIKRVLGEIAPLGYAAEPITVQPWCEQFIKLRAPASFPNGTEVAVLPVDDPTLPDLGLLVATTIARVKDGYIIAKVLNISREKKTIPLLRPVIRFIIDPRLGGPEVEFETNEVMERIHVGPSSPRDRKKCAKMLDTRLSIFRTTLGYSHTPQIKIETPLVDSGVLTAPARNSRPRPPEVEAVLENTVQKLYKGGIVEPGRSPYNAEMLPLVKPDGTIRPATDYRDLNLVVEKDSFPLPNADANLNALGRAKWFTTLDLLQGFLQLELTQDSKHKTAFTVNGRQWQYTRLPMGLTTSPSAFMRVVDATLRGLPPGIAFAYCDDVIIATGGDLDEHLQAVGSVFDKLIQAGFAVRCDKVHLAMKQVMYLGFLVGENGTKPHPSKTAALMDMTVEAMGHDPAAAARYAGMIGFYHKFLPDLHSTLAPFHQLKSKGADGKEIMSSLKFRAAFELSKQQLAAVTALARPDYTKTFYIDVDASSSVGTGAVLMQYQDENDPTSLRPLAFWSKRFNSEERRYGVRDQECQGLAEALEAWRPYISYGKIVVRTDHKSLEWLLSTHHKEGTRVSGFAMKIQGYDVTIKYIAGTTNIIADCMSRNIPESPSTEEGGRERGKALPPSLFARPEIEDRVHEIVLEKAELVPGRHRVPPAALPVAATVGDKEDASQKEVVHFQEAHGLTAVGQAPARRNRLRVAAAPPHTADRHSDRAVVFVLRMGEEGVSLLIEEQDGHTTIPGVSEVLKKGSRSYRAQLIERIHHTYEEPEALIRTIVGGEHRRSRRRYAQHFFIAYFPSGQTVPRIRNSTLKSSFRRLDIDLLGSLSSASDREVAMLFASEYIMKGFTGTDSFQEAAAQRCRTQVSVAAARVEEAEVSVERRPTKRDPYGPALVDCEQDLRFAFEMIEKRLRDMPSSASVSIDLEGPLLGAGGHVALLQLCIDGTIEGEPPIVYVFDALQCGDAMFEKGHFTLRTVLEDPQIVKVLHCCYGDVGALFEGWGVLSRNVFDTSIGDAIALSRHPGKPRGLGVVLRDWLGEEQVRLTYKDTLEHSPTLFDTRPLTVRLFTYAYEDVTYCNQLYAQLRRALEQIGLLQLTFVLSQQRGPPSALRITHPQHEAPSWIAVALCDMQGQVLCEQELEQGRYRLLHVETKGERNPLLLKKKAQTAWEAQMGRTAKEIDISVRVRLRKPTRVGDTLLYTAYVTELTTLLESLSEGYTDKTHRLVVRQRYFSNGPNSGVREEQRALFQQLQAEAARADLNKPRKRAALVNLFDEQGTLEINVDARVEMHKGRVVLRLQTVIRLAPQGAAALTVTQGQEALRAAVILMDDNSVYTITGNTGIPSFPSHGLAEGTVDEALAQGFDTYAGVALRKLESPDGRATHNVMPRTSRHVRAAEKAGCLVGQFGNTEYYLWSWEPSQGETEAEHKLKDFESSFYAARREANGFQMVPSKVKIHPSFDICPIDTVLEKLREAMSNKREGIMAKFDREALEAARALRVAQHSECVNKASREEADTETKEECPVLKSQTENFEGEREGGSAEVESPLQAVGVDFEFDRLFTCAVAFYAGCCEQGGDVDRPVYAAAEEEETTTKAKSSTEARGRKMTRQWLILEQSAHPGTAQYVAALLEGELAGEAIEDISPKALQSMQLEEGLLVWRPEGASFSRAVLTPTAQEKVLQRFHEGHGHLGVRKVLEHISRRYYWGSQNEMRKTVSEHIRKCEACARVKLPRHRLGEMQILDCGDHPWDIISGDLFDVGVNYEGYSHTLDFVCHFSRRVISTPMLGIPRSELIARALLDRVIRVHGVPSEIRSDQGSNFISKGLRDLYDAFGIHMNPGSAYTHHLVALVERWHQTLLQLLRVQKAAGMDENWPSRLSLLELAYNTAVNDTTGYSPFFIDHLRHATLPLDVMLKGTSRAGAGDLPEWVRLHLESSGVVYDAVVHSLRLNALHAKRRFDLRHDVVTTFKPGDRVLLIRGEVMDKSPMSKADLPTEGPFTVARVLEHGRYVLKDQKSRRVHDVVSISRLLAFPENRTADAEWMVSDPAVGQGKYPVHSVVGRRARANGDVEYKVRWLGFPSSYDRWLCRRYLDSIAPLVQIYDEGQGRVLVPTPRATRAQDAPLPAPSEEAVRRQRFRFQPRSMEPARQGGTEAAAGQNETVVQAEKTVEPDLTDHFPVDSIVEVYFEKEKQWYTGTVKGSKIYRPRKDGGRAERRIIVEYEDPAYSGEPFEHGLNNSEVRHKDQTQVSKQGMDDGSENTAEARLKQRQERTMLRLTRQLA